jgi:two-component system response regulator YesN
MESAREFSDDYASEFSIRYTSDDRLLPGYWADKGKQIIDQNYARLNGVGDVCNELDLSPSRFRDVFYSAFGITPKLYLNKIRIEHSISLLMNTQNNIREIGMIVGFKERSAFERIFKKLVGLTPSDYRRRCGAGDFVARK